MKLMNKVALCALMISTQIATPKSMQSHVTVTVWVHGTYPALTVLGHKWSPLRPWVYVTPGLSLAKELPKNYYYHQLAYDCQIRDSEEYNVDHFYTFGWHSSNVRPKNRKKVGKQLYQELNELLQDYKKKYRTVKVRIIGFSHGGNVILNCMSHFPFDCKGIEIEPILIATPIQESTRWYVNSPYVKRVFSLYSDKDWIQRIDMQKLHRDAPHKTPLLSGRKFANSDRVVQVNLLFNGKSLGHAQYRPIVKWVPDIMKQIYKMVDDSKCEQHIGLNFKTK